MLKKVENNPKKCKLKVSYLHLYSFDIEIYFYLRKYRHHFLSLFNYTNNKLEKFKKSVDNILIS